MIIKFENKAKVVGIVTSIEKEYETDINNQLETFYRVMLDIPRFSENHDIVPFIMSSKTIRLNGVEVDSKVCVEGSIRTRNVDDETGHHKKVYGFAAGVAVLTDEEYETTEEKNRVYLEGVICMKPNFRTTNSGRLITDLVIAQSRDGYPNRSRRRKARSYYLPCLAWGNDAKIAQQLEVGDKICLLGRFQSREYRRKSDPMGEVHVAYEISILEYCLYEENKANEMADAV